MNLTAEIKAIIEKNLPQQVGDTLKSVLEQGAKDAALVVELSQKLERKTQEYEQLKQMRSTYESAQLKLDDANRKMEVVIDKERKLKIDELTFQLNSERENKEFAKSVALGLVRNIEYRNDSFGNNSKNRTDENGRYLTENFNNCQNTVAKAE